MLSGFLWTQINTLSMPFCLCWSYGCFTDCVFLLCLKGIHNGLHLPSPLPFVFHPPVHAHIHFFSFLAEELSFCVLFGFLSTPWFLFTPPYSHWPFLCFPGMVVAWWHSSPLSTEPFIQHASFLPVAVHSMLPLFPPDFALLQSDFPLLFLSAVCYL